MTSLNLSNNPLLSTVRLTNTTLTEIDLRNGNNANIQNENFDISENPDLICVFVDDATWSTENWLNIDTNSHFVETQTEWDVWTGVDEQLQDQFSIYPSPTSGLLYIDIDNSPLEGGVRGVLISDILGKQLLKYNSFQPEINLTPYPSGIYFVTLQSDRQNIVYKIIKSSQ